MVLYIDWSFKDPRREHIGIPIFKIINLIYVYKYIICQYQFSISRLTIEQTRTILNSISRIQINFWLFGTQRTSFSAWKDWSAQAEAITAPGALLNVYTNLRWKNLFSSGSFVVQRQNNRFSFKKRFGLKVDAYSCWNSTATEEVLQHRNTQPPPFCARVGSPGFEIFNTCLWIDWLQPIYIEPRSWWKKENGTVPKSSPQSPTVVKWRNKLNSYRISQHVNINI